MKLGFLEPTTGALAAGYGPLFVPAQFAIKEINDAGGILGKPVTQKAFNDQGAAADEGSAAHQLISAGYQYALGPVGTTQVLASYAATQKNNKLIQCVETMSPSVNSPQLYPGGFSPILQSQGAAKLFVEYLVGTLGGTKIGLMYENTGYGTEGAKYFKQSLQSTGAQIVGTESYDVGSTTIQSNLLRLKSAGANCLMIWCTTPGDVTNIFTSIEQLGMIVPIGSSSSFSTYLAKLLPKLNPKIVDQTYIVVNKTFTFTPSQPAAPEVVDYADKVFAFGKIPGVVQYSAIQGPYYDFIYMLKRSIEAAKSTDYDKVLQSLQTAGPYQGKVGTINFTNTDHVGFSTSNYAVGKASGLLNEKLSHGWMTERVA